MSLVGTTKATHRRLGGRRHLPRHQGLALAAPEGPPAKHEGDISGQLRSRGRQHISGQLRSTRETSLARTTHRWDPASPANAGWQQMEATDASHRHITTTTPATPRGTTLARLYTATSAKPRETTLPWPDTHTTHPHYTPAKPRETTLLWPGTTPSRLRSRGTTLARHHIATPPPPTGAPPR